MRLSSIKTSFENASRNHRAGRTTMAVDPDSLSPDEQTAYELTIPSISTDPLYQYELLLMETPILPQPQPTTFLPPKWYIIPQERYTQKQWAYRPTQDILFQVN